MRVVDVKLLTEPRNVGSEFCSGVLKYTRLEFGMSTEKNTIYCARKNSVTHISGKLKYFLRFGDFGFPISDFGIALLPEFGST